MSYRRCNALQQTLEDAHMTHPVAIHAIKVQKIAHKALKALGFINLNTLFKRDRHVRVAFLAGPLHAPTAIHTNNARAPHSESQQTPHPLQISVDDWDILFRAIQVRLKDAVADSHPSGWPSQTDATAGQVQTTVLECISAMEQLHAALGHERRAQRDEHLKA